MEGKRKNEAMDERKQGRRKQKKEEGIDGKNMIQRIKKKTRGRTK